MSAEGFTLWVCFGFAFLASSGHQSDADSVLGEYSGNQLSTSERLALRVKDGYCFRKRQ